MTRPPTELAEAPLWAATPLLGTDVLQHYMYKYHIFGQSFYICLSVYEPLKAIVQFEMNFWYVLAYLKVIQDVGVFVSAVA